jgi:hypothetical protein
MDLMRITTANLDDGKSLAADWGLPRAMALVTDCHI